MSMPSQPAPPTPGQAAVAQTGTQEAAQIEQIASSPMNTYADIMNQLQFDPIYQQLQGTNQARSALQSGISQRAALQQANPNAFASQNMLAQMGSNRLAQVLGVDPNKAMQASTANTYNYPSTAQLPNFNMMGDFSNAVAQAIPIVQVNKDGQVTGINKGQNFNLPGFLQGYNMPYNTQTQGALPPPAPPPGANAPPPSVPSVPGYVFDPKTQRYISNTSGTSNVGSFPYVPGINQGGGVGTVPVGAVTAPVASQQG